MSEIITKIISWIIREFAFVMMIIPFASILIFIYIFSKLIFGIIKLGKQKITLNTLLTRINFLVLIGQITGILFVSIAATLGVIRLTTLIQLLTTPTNQISYYENVYKNSNFIIKEHFPDLISKNTNICDKTSLKGPITLTPCSQYEFIQSYFTDFGTVVAIPILLMISAPFLIIISSIIVAILAIIVKKLSRGKDLNM